jgi:uncharacterized membrane protein
MVIGCLASFGITYNGHYSWLHGLAIFTISQLLRGILAIRHKNLKIHRRALIGSYLGTVTAFLFAASFPNRLISEWLRNLFI